MAIIKMKKLTLQDSSGRELIIDVDGVDKQKSIDNTIFFVSKAENKIKEILDANGYSYDISNLSCEDKPTIVLKNLRFFKPFCSLITDQVLPNYGDIDPTAFYAICFCVLFGVMFGDIGQGLILIIIGIVFNKNDKLAIFSRVGLFSVLFGWLYGSVFGNEEIIGEMMQYYHVSYWRFGLLERNNTEILLLVVAAIGIFMIIWAILINVIDKLLHKEKKEIFKKYNCLPALLFYLMILLLTGQVLGKAKGKFTLILALIMDLISIALLLISGKWQYLASSVIKYFSAIMSFLQVGCFALAHAFLMYIVYYVASLVPAISLIIVIVGNVLVMAIEATEVWHQCNHLILSTLHGFIAD